jgi:hypothetical protein
MIVLVVVLVLVVFGTIKTEGETDYKDDDDNASSAGGWCL